jgi:hypothetical protein
MVDLRSYPLPGSVAAWLKIGHPADTDCTGNDPTQTDVGLSKLA